MSASKIKTRLNWLIRDHLGELGFEPTSPRVAERCLPDVVQSIELQPGTGYLKGKYTMNIFSRFTFPDSSLGGFQNSMRLGRLLDEGDIWYSTDAAHDERHFERISLATKAYVIPHLETYRSIESVVEAFELGILPAHKAFTNTHFDFGLCLIRLGRDVEAVDQLKQSIEGLVVRHERHRIFKVTVDSLIERCLAA